MIYGARANRKSNKAIHLDAIALHSVCGNACHPDEEPPQ